jgi:hypothetical protein
MNRSLISDQITQAFHEGFLQTLRGIFQMSQASKDVTAIRLPFSYNKANNLRKSKSRLGSEMLCSRFEYEESDNFSDFQLIFHFPILQKKLGWENIYPLLNTENDRPEKEFSTPDPMKALHFASPLLLERNYGEAFY